MDIPGFEIFCDGKARSALSYLVPPCFPPGLQRYPLFDIPPWYAPSPCSILQVTGGLVSELSPGRYAISLYREDSLPARTSLQYRCCSSPCRPLSWQVCPHLPNGYMYNDRSL